jgi:integrase/recombinase XerD
MGLPVITIFVRHTPDCKYLGDEFHKGCRCRKHLRWSKGGKQYRKTAGTRSWEQAETVKLQLQAQLSGTLIPHAPKTKMSVAEAVEVFMTAKRNDGLELPTIQKLGKTTARIQDFCTAGGVYFLEDVNLTHVTTWAWTRYFATTHSLVTNQERVKSFFRYFHNAGVIAVNPAASWKRIKGKVEQVSGFSPAEFQKILNAIPKCEFSGPMQQRLRALVLVMRYAGLAIIDAATLERSQIHKQGNDYRIQLTSRQKTSKRSARQAIDNAIPKSVSVELLAVLNGNPRYVFWDGGKTGEGRDSEKREAVKYWHKQIRTLLDKAGFPNATGHKFRHTLAIEMIRHGATFEDVAAALGNTVGVVAKFYSHEWAKVRQGKTDDAIKATWGKK